MNLKEGPLGKEGTQKHRENIERKSGFTQEKGKFTAFKIRG